MCWRIPLQENDLVPALNPVMEVFHVLESTWNLEKNLLQSLSAEKVLNIKLSTIF